MRTRLLNLLLLTGLALAAVRFQAFLRESPQRSTPESATAPQPTAEPPLQEGPDPAGAAQTQGYDVIVARDLFSPARGVVPAAPGPAGQPAPKSQPPPKLALYGVVLLDGEKFAYLHEGAPEAKPRKVREGDNFAGGTVVAIRRDAVTLLFGGSEISVQLRTPKEGIAQAPAVQPPAPGATERGAIQPGSAAVPRRIPTAPRYQPPGSSTVPPGSPTPAARRFPPTRIPADDTVVDEGILPEEEIGEGDLQYLGEESVEE